jgi:hypothetical protein
LASRRNPTRRLVPVEELTSGEDLAAWLEHVSRTLAFRSHCAMHKAIASHTGLNYDTVHKALTPATHARRLRPELVRCLQGWLEAADAGKGLDIPDEFRGVPVGDLQEAMPALRCLFGTKQAVYARISRETGINPVTVRRYFQESGPVRTAPLTVANCVHRLRQLRRDDLPKATPAPARRQPPPNPTLAELATEAFRDWRRSGGNPETESHYRALRRELIAELHARRHMVAGA